MYVSSESSESSVVSRGPGSCREPVLLDQYEVLRAIGHGQFGQVHLARHHFTGVLVAVKALKVVEQNFPVLCEHRVLMRLEHPNVVQLFQVIPTQEHVYLVMEYAGGEQLLQRIPAGGMQQEEARRMFREIVCALGHCHEQGVVHRDLKPENIMVDGAGHIKLIDFGLSARCTAGQRLKNFCGTLPYLAPEIVLHREYEGPPADIWSLGVILYLMLTGSRPFGGTSAEEMVKHIVLARYRVPCCVSRQARRLLCWILTLKPKKRPTAKQILQHPWLSQGEPCVPCPSSLALPARPDPAILTLLFDMGFDPYQTWVSLAKRKFDAAMATYLLLKRQQAQGVRCVFQEQSVPPWLRHGPRPEDLSDVPVLPRRSASEPALPTSPLPCEHPLPEKAQEPGHRGSRSASVPAIPLRSLPAGAPTLRTSSRSDSGFPTCDPSTAFERCSTTHSSTGSSQDSASAQGPGHTTVWKRLRRRMAACVRRLCCCLPPGPTKVAPVPQRRNQHASRDISS